MRILTFGTEQRDKDRFDILYGGACVSPRGIGRTELNTFNILMRLLEAIAKPIDEAPEGALCKFELSDNGGKVILQEPEYKLLNELHNPVRWAKSHTVKAEETYDWLEAIPKVKKEDAIG